MPWTPIEADSDWPLYVSVYKRIRHAIRGGLVEGKLPSKNQAAKLLSVSKVTIEQAYRQLVSEGYIHSRPRSGFYVNPGFMQRAPQDAAHDEADFPPQFKSEYCFDLSTYAVATECFPFAVWSRLSRQLLSEESDKLLNSTPGKGFLALRQQICGYLQNYRGVRAHPEQILLGAGTEWAASIFNLLFTRGQRFAIENPSYSKVWRILSAHGRDILRVPMCQDGIDLAELQKAKPDLVHISPAHHFPLGLVMPIQQRLALLKLAEQMDFYMIEDDYDCEFRFEGRPIPALKSLDGDERVIYLNTFTKSLAPSLRISYMLLPRALLEKYERELSFYACTVPGFQQYVLARFMGEGHFSTHLKRMRRVYKDKHDALLEALRQSSLGKHLEISGEKAGLHFLLRLKGELNEAEMLSRAAAQGIKLSGLSEFYSPKINVPQATVLMGFAKLKLEELPELISRLQNAWSTP